MIWNKLVKSIKDLFGQPDKKEWFDKLIQDAEIIKNEGRSIPFKIIDIKEKGFIVKVSGLFAYISFNHMPWKYSELNSWRVIYPKLADKRLYCKIYEIKKEPLSILVDGGIAQFKTAELNIGKEYSGIIIKKSAYGLLIDIGFHFNWECGSLVGLLHITQFQTINSFKEFKAGEEIKVAYQGLNENGQLIFGDDLEIIDWFLGKPQELLGKVIWARVIKKQGTNEIGMLVKGKYQGRMTAFTKEDYSPKYLKKIKLAANELNDGKIINCEVVGYDERKRILKVNWHVEIDTDILIDNSLMNCIDDETIKKLTNIKNEIEK